MVCLNNDVERHTSLFSIQINEHYLDISKPVLIYFQSKFKLTRVSQVIFKELLK